MNTAMTRAAQAFGGYAGLARALSVSAPSVHEWASGRRPVPSKRCVQIERMTMGAVRRWDLRPHDWHEQWPELVGHPDAPPVPAEAGAA